MTSWAELEQLRQHDKEATDLTIDQAQEIGRLRTVLEQRRDGMRDTAYLVLSAAGPRTEDFKVPCGLCKEPLYVPGHGTAESIVELVDWRAITRRPSSQLFHERCVIEAISPEPRAVS